MATYLVLNIFFIAIVLLVLLALKAVRFSVVLLSTLALLLVLTAVFDSLIISAGIVSYNEQKLLGIFIGAAPIEDFFYAVLAGILIPSVWHITERKPHHGNN